MPNTAIYCPGVDEEMNQNLSRLVECKWADKSNVFTGGKKELGRLDPSWKLYLLAHGHAQMPLFSTKAGKWTAKQMVDLMVSDGLKKSHRVIELLVCHAGESITSKSAAKERMSLYQRFLLAQSAKDQKKQNQLVQKFTKVVEKGPKPSAFTREDQTLPVCAQFVQELKHQGFSNIRVIGYAAPVCQYYSDGPGKVRLDTTAMGGGWGANDENTMKRYTVTWL